MSNFVKKYINMNYNELVKLSKGENIDDLKLVVSRMAKTANRRISTLLKDDVGAYSPAYKILKDSGVSKFSVKEIENMNESTKLVEEYNTLKNFLKAKSSTLGGWRKIRERIAKRTGATKLFSPKRKSARSAKIWSNREKRFWNLYNHLINNYGGVVSQLNSDQVQSLLSKIQLQRNQAKSDEDISKAIIVYIDNIYRDKNFNEKAFLNALKDEEYMEEVRIAYEKLSGN